MARLEEFWVLKSSEFEDFRVLRSVKLEDLKVLKSSKLEDFRALWMVTTCLPSRCGALRLGRVTMC